MDRLTGKLPELGMGYAKAATLALDYAAIEARVFAALHPAPAGPEMIRADVAFAIETIAKYPDGVDYIPHPVFLLDHFGTHAPRPLVYMGSGPWRRWSGRGVQAQNLPRAAT